MFNCCGFKLEEGEQIKFILSDGTEIGPFTYGLNTSVRVLKSEVVYYWPTGKENPPETADCVELYKGDDILANTKLLSEFNYPRPDNDLLMLTLRVVVLPPSAASKAPSTDLATRDVQTTPPKTIRCCSIPCSNS
ncbi:UBL3-like, ubiquitin domain [Dillenia turbinata]|uniref:UBL3-like, ubiquitin domain n=1 Tax=Dillenia turbinata TaxID=194707 RepID=A0AAN8UVU7_9MAGN